MSRILWARVSDVCLEEVASAGEETFENLLQKEVEGRYMVAVFEKMRMSAISFYSACAHVCGLVHAGDRPFRPLTVQW